jgi:hypothetical protein
MPVNWNDLLDGYEFVSFEGGSIEHRAWLCKTSGKIYWDFGDESFEEEEEEEEDDEESSDESNDHDSAAGPAVEDDPERLPRDIENEEKYLPIPSKRDLDLGRPLVFRFIGEVLPNDYNEVRRIFERRGAYSNFKALLSRRNALDRWYAFEEKATVDALREWCKDNAIEIEEPAPRPEKGTP